MRAAIRWMHHISEEGRMKVKVAETAGFCWGVQRAVSKVMKLRSESGESIQTFGPLIHNAQVLKRLEEEGVKTELDLESLNSSHVVIRTHGIPPEERHRIKEKDAKILDTTCPDVAKIHARILRCVRAGMSVIIAGHNGHPEIKGLMGYAGEAGFLVESVADVAKLPALERVAMVSQSTFSKADLAEISSAIKQKFPEAEIFSTICDATHNRQEEVKRMASEVEVMVVIGGRNSSNTKRLFEVSSETGTQTYHIETEQELSQEMFDGIKIVGVTAGASTPDWVIEKVTSRLHEFSN
jgi:(E)-4-hydroxy-3-methyl-but-2-enyl pyrophosphate reductase